MVNRHFFKPLLPGFHSHLTIPVDFFLKDIQVRTEQQTAELRSDASKITWKVKLDGQRFTEGWKEFALSHDLRIGDILVFRHEGDMSFHVTILGPSCCEIQYESFLDDLDDKNNLEKIETRKEVKKNRKREDESSSLDPSCFVANVRCSNLHYDLLHLPRGFVRANSIVTGCGEIVLMNEKGKSWTLKLRQKPTCGTIYIRGGWRSFCDANGFKAGDSLTFKLIHREGTLVLRLSSKESKEEAKEVSLSTKPERYEERNIGKSQRKKKMKKKKPRRELQDPSCFETNIAPSSLRYDVLYLPMRFLRKNCLLSTRCKKMTLMNEKGRSWTLDLKRRISGGITIIKRGWTSFCSANGLKAGSIITFKLIQKGESLVLRLTPNESEEECSEANEVESLSTDQESDEESSQEEKVSQEVSRRKEKKHRSTWKASLSPSQNRFVTLTLKPFNTLRSVLRLPVPFTRANGINEGTKMTLLDKYGVEWPTDPRLEDEKSQRIRLVGGWKGFLKANSVETNESYMLELIRKEDASCVLKFCSKVKLETK